MEGWKEFMKDYLHMSEWEYVINDDICSTELEEADRVEQKDEKDG